MSNTPPHQTPAPLQRTPLGQSFVASRSISLAIIGLLGVTGLGWYVLSHHGGQIPKSAAITHPDMAAPAGGDNHSPVLDNTARLKEQEDARKALEKHNSYTGAITTRSKIGDDTAPDLGKTPGASSPTGTTTTTTNRTKPSDGASNPFTADPTHHESTHGSAEAKHAKTGSMSDQAEASLIAAWTGGSPSLDLLNAQEGGNAGGSASADPKFARAPEGAAQISASAAPAAATMPKAPTPARHPLLAAGRGVYGHAVLTANSDIGGEALVEIDSGPLVHARVSGSFQRKDDRLVIKFDKLMIGDADPIAISAYAVSPDTAETGVASEVREHIATRLILPAASAFVEGLGNAMQNTNTTSYTAGLGLSSFTHLTLPQQMGVAAGRAGQELGQILQQQTPQQPTVLLKAGTPIGVLFDEPVYAS